MFCQARNAFRRNSSSHSGSFFFAEIARTTSSLRPGGSVSDSMSVTKPYLYSRVASCSMVSVDVDISGLSTWVHGSMGPWVHGEGTHEPLWTYAPMNL